MFFMCMSMNNREESQWLRKVLTQIDRAWAEHKAATGETEDEPMPLTFHEHKGIMRAYSKCEQVDAARRREELRERRLHRAAHGRAPPSDEDRTPEFRALEVRVDGEAGTVFHLHNRLCSSQWIGAQSATSGAASNNF